MLKLLLNEFIDKKNINHRNNVKVCNNFLLHNFIKLFVMFSLAPYDSVCAVCIFFICARIVIYCYVSCLTDLFIGAVCKLSDWESTEL